MMVIQDDALIAFSERFLPRLPATLWTPPALTEMLSFTIALLRILYSLHSLGIVHGSLRPTTISTSIFEEVHVHDFSCAFRTSIGGAEEGPIRERGMREESLPYLAPECTGRVGKTADYRSDFYSVGATLFEILVGHPPFADADDPLEIIHAHIARRPPLVDTIDPSIPHELALIVAKLLEKSPDERYQTSQGLIVDLQKVSDLVRGCAATSRGDTSHQSNSSSASARPQPPAFLVGSLDSAAHFSLPPADTMYGREEDVQRLVEAYERVKQGGATEAVVVKGASGIGKTSLVEGSLRARERRGRGYFSSVKFGALRFPAVCIRAELTASARLPSRLTALHPCLHPFHLPLLQIKSSPPSPSTPSRKPSPASSAKSSPNQRLSSSPGADASRKPLARKGMSSPMCFPRSRMFSRRGGSIPCRPWCPSARRRARRGFRVS